MAAVQDSTGLESPATERVLMAPAPLIPPGSSLLVVVLVSVAKPKQLSDALQFISAYPRLGSMPY